MEKSNEEIASIAKDIINLLAEKNCTIVDANNVLSVVRLSIDNTSMVRKIDW